MTVVHRSAFGEPLFDRYAGLRGIEDGFFERRRFVYRLYPLLVHVHPFGGRYATDLDAVLGRVERRISE
ncbi:fructosamine kinase family protein [Haloferacaceae archaeon DSL9]